MRNGEAGFGSFSVKGASRFLAYASIAGTDGWSIGVKADTSDFMSSTIYTKR